MARPSFTTTLPSTYHSDVNGTVSTTDVTSASMGREVVSGTAPRPKPDGFVAPTSYSLLRETYTRANGQIDHRRTRKSTGVVDDRRLYFGCVGGGAGGCNSLNAFNDVYMPLGVPAAWRTKVLTDARIKMKQADVNLAVAFAERNKTARMIGDTAIQLVRSARLLRKGNFWGAARELGINNPRKPRGSSVTARWLELQYGWKPLLSDVYGSVDALARRDKSDWIVTAKSAYSEPVEGWYDTETMSPSVSPFLDSDYGFGFAAGFRGAFCRIDAIPENDLLKVMSSLGVTNPGLIAWELVPFSFVVDWFLPVGDFIDQLDALLGYGPSWSSISSIEKVAWSYTLSNSQGDNSLYDWDIRRSGKASKTYVKLDRTGGAGVPLATFPPIKDPLSLGHMANGLSLLTQTFGRRR